MSFIAGLHKYKLSLAPSQENVSFKVLLNSNLLVVRQNMTKTISNTYIFQLFSLNTFQNWSQNYFKKASQVYCFLDERVQGKKQTRKEAEGRKN